MARTPLEEVEMEELLRRYFQNGGVVHRYPQGHKALPPYFMLNRRKRNALAQPVEDGVDSKKQRTMSQAQIAKMKRLKMIAALGRKPAYITATPKDRKSGKANEKDSPSKRAKRNG